MTELLRAQLPEKTNSRDLTGLLYIPEYPSGFRLRCTDTRTNGFRLMLQPFGWFHRTDTAGGALPPAGWPSGCLFCHTEKSVRRRGLFPGSAGLLRCRNNGWFPLRSLFLSGFHMRRICTCSAVSRLLILPSGGPGCHTGNYSSRILLWPDVRLRTRIRMHGGLFEARSGSPGGHIRIRTTPVRFRIFDGSDFSDGPWGCTDIRCGFHPDTAFRSDVRLRRSGI